MTDQAFREALYRSGQPSNQTAQMPPHYPPKHADEERLTALLMGIILRLDRIEKRLEELDPKSLG